MPAHDITADTWRDLVEAARWAPSPHNTQPWKLRVFAPDRAQLCIARDRMLPDEDLTGAFIDCAMGIFIEALTIIAANRALRVKPRRTPVDPTGAGDLIPFVELTLHPDPSLRPEFTEEIFLRRTTSRLQMERRPLPAELRDALLRTARDAGQTLTFIDDPDRIRRVIDLNIDALFADLNHRPYHDEIVSWFRAGKRRAAETRDGLDARCMNMPPHEMRLIDRAPFLLRAPILSTVMRARYRRRLGHTQTLACIAGPFFKDDAAWLAGRVLLRLWLTMEHHHIRILPFGNLVTNQPAHRALTELIGIDNIWIVFRLGYTAEPPRPHRLPAEAILC